MRRILVGISIITAFALGSTPIGAQDDPAPDRSAIPDGVPVIDEGVGDASVRLLTTQTPEVLPGQDAWIHFVWNGDPLLEARDFRVTAEGSEGVEVGYPGDHNLVGRDFTSLLADDTLAPVETDFTAIRLRVDPGASEPRIRLTVSFDSDTGPVTQTEVVPVVLDDTEFVGQALEFGAGPMGILATGTEAWLDLDVVGLVDAYDIEFRVTDSGRLDVDHPNELDHSSLSQGSRLAISESDQAAFRFDAFDVDPGAYRVIVEATYRVGLTRAVQTVERIVIVNAATTPKAATAPTASNDRVPTGIRGFGPPRQ